MSDRELGRLTEAVESTGRMVKDMHTDIKEQGKSIVRLEESKEDKTVVSEKIKEAHIRINKEEKDRGRFQNKIVGGLVVASVVIGALKLFL